MLPIAACARLGLPLVDADGMGRAFPELQMVTFTIGGISASPMALTCLLYTSFKSDLKKLSDTDLIEAVIGMTNTEGGVLFLGVEDNGDITGVHKHHTDEIGAAALIANRTVPSVPVRTELMHEEGYDVLKIEIPMSKTIVASSDGKILRRRLKLDGTPQNIPMYPYEINTRLSELSLSLIHI